MSNPSDELVLLPGINGVIRTVDEHVKVVLKLDVDADQNRVGVEKNFDILQGCIWVFF